VVLNDGSRTDVATFENVPHSRGIATLIDEPMDVLQDILAGRIQTRFSHFFSVHIFYRTNVPYFRELVKKKSGYANPFFGETGVIKFL
jgi:hypothetical protein